MTISIITPSLNQAEFIEETIKSIIYQKGNFKLEYIIIDGKSTDNTLQILKKYDKLIKSKKFKPNCKKLTFKWISEKDKGQSHAINKGFRIASGNLINWICADDMLLPDSLQFITKIFRNNNEKKVIFGSALLYYGENFKKVLKGKNFSKKEIINVWSKLLHKFYIPQSSVFYRKEVIDKVGMLDEKNHLCMDYDFWLRILEKYKFFYYNKVFSIVRLHEDAKSIKYKYQQYKVMIKISKNYWRDFGLPTYIYFILSYYIHFPINKIKEFIYKRFL